MKIINSISSIYFERLPLMKLLKEKVDETIKTQKKESWHFYSRIKSEESFALKIETGRVKEPRELEDFFGGTIVVENFKEIKNAIEFIKIHFDIVEKRPKSEDFTHKESFSFPFDDLRLYLTFKKIDYLPEDPISDIRFEIQIKTFLQHAWSIATHDMIYKSEHISWAKERVAYQIKAMLEQAEISISGADELSHLPELAKENYESTKLNKVKSFLIETFNELLPSDILRITRIVNDILIVFNIDYLALKRYIDAETILNRGIKTLNLSPYGIIIQSIINQDPDTFQFTLNASKLKIKTKLFLPFEINLNDITLLNEENFIRL